MTGSQEEQTEPPSPKQHSLAFEQLVQSSDDIVGLIAYAKFKQSIREGAINGNVPDPAARDLTPVMVNVLRSAAEQMIAQVVNDGIAAATPDIQGTAAVAAIDATRQEILAAFGSNHTDTLRAIKEETTGVEQHVTKRTGFWVTFGINIAAWFVSVVIIVIIVLSRGGPSLEDTLLDAAPHEAQRPTTE